MREWRDLPIGLVRFAGIMMILFAICALTTGMLVLFVAGMYVTIFGYWVLPLLLKEKNDD